MFFKDGLDRDCVDLKVDKRETAPFLTIAASRGPEISNGRIMKISDVHDLGRTVILNYRMAGHNGKQVFIDHP